jgi:hypothetical protein
MIIKEAEMTKCTCGHDEKDHVFAGCSKCFCSEFSETTVSPSRTLTIGIVVKEDKGEDKKGKEDKSD